MGECFYYLKARFPNTISNELRDELTSFFEDLIEVSHNKTFNNKVNIEKDFPLVAKFEKTLPPTLDGCLCYGYNRDDIDGLWIEDNVLKYSAEVWHFADWSYLGPFLKSQFGAIDYKCMSEEENDYGLCLDAEENADIISSLLSQKKILPTLIGIHPVLDQRIAEELSPKKLPPK